MTTINGITLSSSTFLPGAAANTVVGTIGVQMSSGSFTGSLALSGVNAPMFKIASSSLEISGNGPNLMTNITNQGAVVGTPGTLPTGWSISGLGSLSRSVVGFGTDNSTGLPYLDLRIFGTTNSTSIEIVLPGPASATASTSYMIGAYVSYSAGSLSHITSAILDYESFTSSYATFLGDTVQTTMSITSTPTLYSGTGTTPATTADVIPSIFVNFTSGVAIDVTFRIGGILFVRTGVTPSAGSYPVSIVAIQAGISNSPYSQSQTLLAAYPTISGITLSSSTFPPGAAANTVVGAISVQMASGSFSGSLTLSGANAPRFKIVGSNLEISGNGPNLMTNITNQGVAVGTPGTLPTGWSISGLGSLSSSVVGSGTDNSTGLPYLDLRIFGTTNSTSIEIVLPGPASATASTSYMIGAYVSYSAGSLSHITSAVLDYESFTSSYANFLGDTVQTTMLITSTPTLYSGTGTTPATTANVIPSIFVNFTSGVAIDVTFRIGGILFVQTGVTPSAGSYPVNIVAIQASATNSPYSQSETLTASISYPFLVGINPIGLSSSYSSIVGMNADFSNDEGYTYLATDGSNWWNGGGQYPIIVNTSHFEQAGGTSAPAWYDPVAAANGSYDTYYHNFVNALGPYAQYIYAIRIDFEWCTSGPTGYWSPFHQRGGSINYASPWVSAATWNAGWIRMVNIIRADSRFNGVKIAWDYPLRVDNQFGYNGTSAGVLAYYPGDAYVDLICDDPYFYGTWNGTATSTASWNYYYSASGGFNLQDMATFAASHSKPLAFFEWGDAWMDGVCINNFGNWMKAQANTSAPVVLHSYWAETTFAWDTNTTAKAAWLNQFGPSAIGTTYNGTYWTHKSTTLGTKPPKL